MIKSGKNKNYLFFSIGFGITLIVFILFIFIYKGSYENFANTINFMTKEESQIFMQKDEDYYIRNLSIYDLRARKVATNDDYLKIAINSCMDFNESQKENQKENEENIESPQCKFFLIDFDSNIIVLINFF